MASNPTIDNLVDACVSFAAVGGAMALVPVPKACKSRGCPRRASTIIASVHGRELSVLAVCRQCGEKIAKAVNRMRDGVARVESAAEPEGARQARDLADEIANARPEPEPHPDPNGLVQATFDRIEARVGRRVDDFDKPCRVCGCTDRDCSRCIAKTGYPCHWVEPDLCSACVAENVNPPA